MLYPGIGRRSYFRLAIKVPVKLDFYPATKQNLSETVTAVSRDVSGQGIAVELDKPEPEWVRLLEVGKTEMSVEFTLPGSKTPVLALVRVVWLTQPRPDGAGEKSYALGLRFLTVPARDRARLVRYIDAAYEKMASSVKEKERTHF